MTDTLLCLPGFLGQQDDFNILQQKLAGQLQVSCLMWPDVSHETDTEHFARNAWLQLRNSMPQQFYVYGYSMGGRLLMHWLQQEEFRARCLGAFVAAAHTGLNDPAQRLQRIAQDEQWAVRFESEPLESVLTDWYQQPVFAQLPDNLRQQFIQRRASLDGARLATQLRCVSLGRQQNLSDRLHQFKNLNYLVGSLDRKFLHLTQQLNLTSITRVISASGHVAHLEQPQRVAEVIQETISTWRQNA